MLPTRSFDQCVRARIDDERRWFGLDEIAELAAEVLQGNAGGGAYATLMWTLGDGLAAFYADLRNQGLLNDTLILHPDTLKDVVRQSTGPLKLTVVDQRTGKKGVVEVNLSKGG